MMARFRKTLGFTFSILLVILQAVPLSFLTAYAAETAESVDEQMVASFQRHKPNYLALENTDILLEDSPEVTQQFSFVEKTFRTFVGQPVILRFTSTFEADEVVLRIPENGEIAEAYFSAGETIRHSHGEYWLLQSKNKQTRFEVPVVFDTPGKYFLTIDHDADHFYLEVGEAVQEGIEIDNQTIDITNGGTRSREMSEEDKNEYSENINEGGNQTSSVQPATAKEENLKISEEVIQAEEQRILQETSNPSNRSLSTVNNWSQFRSAWNNSRTTGISLASSISFSSSILGSSLNTRNSSVQVNGMSGSPSLSFLGSPNYNLEMSGTATLTLADMTFFASTDSIPLIKHSGSGSVIMWGVVAESSAMGTVVEAQNIALNGNFQLVSQRTYPAISVVRNGTLTITPGTALSYISSGWLTSNNNIKPIRSDAASQIILNTNRLAMGTGRITPRSAWLQVSATLSGVNGSQVLSSTSDPNDFAERYTELFNEPWYSVLIFNGRGGDFEPPAQIGTVTANYLDTKGNDLLLSETLTGTVGTPYETDKKEIDGWTLMEVPSNATGVFTKEPIMVNYIYRQRQYPLTFQASPTVGGVPVADAELLINQESTTIHANPNEGYRFVSWEILSGTNAKITDETAEKTTFTMGDSDAVLQAIYEEESTIVPPVDPLDPEKEVNPENPPELPEDQGAMSIDFVSRFTFGEQGISTQTKNYYAKPQRLLASDGSVMEEEERPNYIQISDRRPENDRHGWQLSVTQNSQFTSVKDDELVGARLHLTNQQFATAHGGEAPVLSHEDGVVLVPNHKTELVTADEGQGTGTWIYRFGDGSSAGESVALEVPPTAAPKATTYRTTLTWELSAVPENE